MANDDETVTSTSTATATTETATTATATVTTENGSPAPALLKPSGGSGEGSGQVQDEDCSKEYAPVVELAEVETKTGEEDEDVLFKIRAKLFRFSKELGEWKERGTGDVRILKHRDNHKIRLLMRREKTLKICLNHYINADVELKENVGSDRSWVWHGVDYADGEADLSHLAIRFRDSHNAGLFKKSYDEAREHMGKLYDDDSDKKEDETEEKADDQEEEKEDKDEGEKES